MEKNRGINPIAFLGLIGFLGIFGFFIGSWDWFIFFSWFIWFIWIKRPADERFIANINKSARNSFIIALIGVTTLLALLGLKLPYRIVVIATITLFETLLVGFIASFFFYEKKGN